MRRISRRDFLASAAALSVGAGGWHRAWALDGSQTGVRPPAVGQSWRYAKRDVFTGKIVADEIDTVAAIAGTVNIDARSAADPEASKPGWGSHWLGKYLPKHETVAGPLPGEVQEPWGLVLVDPHWSAVQVYETPLPLWPVELKPGWSRQVTTRYKTPTDESGLLWDQTMTAHAWETVTVPAGQFYALRYTNIIHFTADDPGKSDCQRQETLWFAPDVGRWVLRQSTGTYLNYDSVDDATAAEPGYRWELLGFT